MSGANLIQFMSVLLLWGCSWLAIHYQVTEVSVILSVAYRFILAGLLLFLFCILKGDRLRYSFKEHAALILQGVLLFSCNFIFVYASSAYLPSGLVAVVFSTILIMNIINSRIFFNISFSLQFLIAALLGVLGLAAIFSRDIRQLFAGAAQLDQELIGVGLCLIGTLSASFGNMFVIKVKKMHLPLLPTTAYSMLYASIFCLCTAKILGIPLMFDTSPQYLYSLAYLVFGASLMGFIFYMTLIRQIGASYAAYAFVLIPIVALFLSSLFEDITWQTETYAGLSLIVCSQILALTPNLGDKMKNLWRSKFFIPLFVRHFRKIRNLS